MKDINEVIKQKEAEKYNTELDIAALRRVIPLLEESQDPKQELRPASAFDVKKQRVEP